MYPSSVVSLLGNRRPFFSWPYSVTEVRRGSAFISFAVFWMISKFPTDAWSQAILRMLASSSRTHIRPVQWTRSSVAFNVASRRRICSPFSFSSPTMRYSWRSWAAAPSSPMGPKRAFSTRTVVVVRTASWFFFFRPFSSMRTRLSVFRLPLRTNW